MHNVVWGYAEILPSQTHVANYNCKFKLSTDIEKDPGPRSVCVDPSKTVAALYSQGNEFVCGQNAGQQYVAVRDRK